MKVTVEDIEDNLTRICLDGRMDIEGTQAIEQQFTFAATTRPRRILLDMSRVVFLASIGLRALVTAARAQAARGGKVVIVGAESSVRKVIETSGIDQIIPLFSDDQSARAALQAG